MRTQLYDYIEENKESYQFFDAGLYAPEDFDEFISHHREQGTYGGTMEINAFSELFARRVVVYSHRLPVEVFGNCLSGASIYV